MAYAPGTNTGHGHVWPRPDGMRMRCGGPRLCATCGADLADKCHAAADEVQRREAFEEEVECAHKYLDTQKVPRADSVGKLSLVGRIKGLQAQIERN